MQYCICAMSTCGSSDSHRLEELFESRIGSAITIVHILLVLVIPEKVVISKVLEKALGGDL